MLVFSQKVSAEFGYELGKDFWNLNALLGHRAVLRSIFVSIYDQRAP